MKPENLFLTRLAVRLLRGSLAVLIAITAQGASRKISEYDALVDPLQDQDDLLVNDWDGVSYITKRLSIGQLRSGLDSLSPLGQRTLINQIGTQWNYLSNLVHVINVADYLPGGRPSDTPSVNVQAIQLALDACTNSPNGYSGRRTVYLPAGRYYLNDTLKIRTHDTHVIGDGCRSTLLDMWDHTKDVFAADPWGGWNDGGTSRLWYVVFENFGVTKTKAPASSGMSAAFNLTAPDNSLLWFRAAFRDLTISGFFYGLKVTQCVGLLAERIEAYGNNYAFWMRKCDAATFINCHAGDGYHATYYTNQFGTTHSAAFTYTNWPSTGFALNVLGGEARTVDNVFDLSSGVVNISGFNSELIFGPAVVVHGGAGGQIGPLYFNNYPTNYAGHPYIVFKNGSGKKFHLVNCAWQKGLTIPPWGVSYPPFQVRLEQAGDYLNYSGEPILVTNSATGRVYYEPVSTNAVRLAAGSNVTIATNQVDNVTTYTVSSTGGGGGTTTNAVFYSTVYVTNDFAGGFGEGILLDGTNRLITAGIGIDWANAQDSILVGDGIKATNINQSAGFGLNVKLNNANNAFVVGESSEATANGAIAMGDYARAEGLDAIAVGSSSRARHDGSVVINASGALIESGWANQLVLAGSRIDTYGLLFNNGVLQLQAAADQPYPITLTNAAGTDRLFMVDTNGTAYPSNVVLAVGSASKPSVSFEGDTDTGLFRYSADTIGFSSGGTLYARINYSGITLDNGYMRVINPGTGSAASYTWAGDTDTGLFNVDEVAVGVTVNATEQARFTANGLQLQQITSTNGYYFPSNALSAWPAAPRTPGEAFIGNSNGVIYILTSGTGSAWSATNKLAP